MNQLNPPGAPTGGSDLTDAVSSAMVGLYTEFYGHDRTTATAYTNDNVVVVVVIDGHVAFQEGTEGAFTAAVERLTERSVTAFLSANQTAPGVACELFFLAAASSAN